jgi:hypothetical protein
MFIQNAEYIEGYQLKVYFKDGAVRTIDLYAFLMASKNHLIRKFQNIDLFKQFRVEDGVICWGDNEFDLNPVNIYNGEYDIKKTTHRKTTKTKNLASSTNNAN